MDWWYFLFSSILCAYSLFLTITNFFDLQSKFNFEMIVLSLVTSCWLIISELYQVLPKSNVDIIINWNNIVFIGIVWVYIRISLIFTKFALSKRVKTMSQIAIIFLSILIGLRIGDMILGSGRIFALPGEPTRYLTVSLLILIAHLSASLIFLEVNYFFYRRMYHSIESILGRIANIATILVVISIFTIIAYTVLNILDPGLGLQFLPILRLILASSIFAIIQYFSVNPIILLTNKVNAERLVSTGYIGYFLVSLKDDGPTILNSSEIFNIKYEIDLNSQMLFATAKITVIGLGDSFKNSIFSIPFPKQDNLNTISFSFFHDDPTLKDPRMKGKANAIFSIVIPNSLSPLISLNFDSFPFFRSIVDETPNITVLSETGRLDNLTAKILHQIM